MKRALSKLRMYVACSLDAVNNGLFLPRALCIARSVLVIVNPYGCHCQFVRLSVPLSVTLVDCAHMILVFSNFVSTLQQHDLQIQGHIRMG